MKNTVSTLLAQKQSGDKITMLTAYDYTTARIIDECGINSILVGDSLGMVMLGYENTLPVTDAADTEDVTAASSLYLLISVFLILLLNPP